MRRPTSSPGLPWRAAPLLAVLAGALALRADEVTLDNGQKLVGRIARMDDLDLYLSVHFADANIPVRWKNVVALQTSAPVRVELRDGRFFFADITMTPDGAVTLSQGGDAEPPIRTTRDQLYALEERKGVLDGEVGISGTGSTGNLDSQSLRVYWDLYFRWATQSLQFKGDASFDSTDEETTDRTIYAQLRYDWLFGQPAFLFASVEEHHDYFADIRSRGVATAGAGTYLANTPRFVLRADVGATYTVSRHREAENTDSFGYRPSVFFQWKLPFELRIKDTATYYGNFEEFDDWQARNELLLSREVFLGFHLNGGLTTTWDHGAAEGVEERDNTYFLGVSYEF